jgi:hypothetical protein
MKVDIPSSGTLTQNVIILTDVQVINPTLVCQIIATLTPSALYISLSADYSTISINPSILLNGDIGTHPFTLTVISANFSGSVNQQNYNFNVIVADLCDSTIQDNREQALKDMSYIVDEESATQIFYPFVDSAAIANYDDFFCGPKEYTIVESYSFVNLIPPVLMNSNDPWTIKV